MTVVHLKIMVSQIKWNRIVNKYVPADVVERRMQHATVLRTAVVAAFNNSSKSACPDSSSFPHLV